MENPGRKERGRARENFNRVGGRTLRFSPLSFDLFIRREICSCSCSYLKWRESKGRRLVAFRLSHYASYSLTSSKRHHFSNIFCELEIKFQDFNHFTLGYFKIHRTFSMVFRHFASMFMDLKLVLQYAGLMQKRTIYRAENGTPAAPQIHEFFLAPFGAATLHGGRRVKLLSSDISRPTFVEIEFEWPYPNQNLTKILFIHIDITYYGIKNSWAKYMEQDFLFSAYFQVIFSH